MQQRRKFEDLRPRNGVVETQAPEGIEQALQRIFLTEDGRHLEMWLKAEMRAPAHVGASDAALREADGARRAYDRLLTMGQVNNPVR